MNRGSGRSASNAAALGISGCALFGHAMPDASAALEVLKPIDWLGGMPEEHILESTHELLTSICGTWMDQKGSTYQLTLATTCALNVYTIRPSGRQRYTAHLVRLVESGCQHRVIWGQERYTLAHGDRNSLKWQGRKKGDCYEWTRIA